MKNKQYDHLLKFVMVGNSAVGKSSLLTRFSDDQFNQNYMATIGVDFRFKVLHIENRAIKLQIWDTAGQQRFRTIVNTYYKNSQAVFLIFDLTNRQSFDDIKNYWINEVESFTEQSILMVLIGNKADCERVVPNEEIQAFVNAKHFYYFETSAKTGTNVKQAFNQTAQMIIKKGLAKSKDKQTATLQVPSPQQTPNQKVNCQC